MTMHMMWYVIYVNFQSLINNANKALKYVCMQCKFTKIVHPFIFQWRDINPNQLMDSKLKCVFENPVNSAATTKGTPPSTTTKSDVSAIDGKNKGTGDTAKTSPKVNTVLFLYISIVYEWIHVVIFI